MYAKVLNYDTGRQNHFMDAEPNGVYKGRLLADSAHYAYQETGEGEIVLHDKSDVGEITLEQIRNRDGVLIAYDGRGASISMNAAAARGAEMEDDGYEMG